MIRVFNYNEIPIGYQEAINSDNIDINQVKYVLHSNDSETWRVAEKLGYYQLIPTMTDEWLYVIM